jgi:uncharacterized protein involved in exopolysaccharide biosynthesis
VEEEIDLRQYIDALLRWWWLIVLGALLAGAGAFLVSTLISPTYEATAGVVTLRSRAELSLGSEFQSISDESLLAGNAGGNAIVDLNQRRLQSLTGLVGNGAIAQQVGDELSDVLDVGERDPSVLIGNVRGAVLEESDTIQIIVSHSDPIKAAAIANAWARAFETHANAIYGEAALAPFADIHEQVESARAEYEQAQEALVIFIGEQDRISELQRQVEEEEAIIAKLREGRQEDISTVVDSQVAVQRRLFETSIEAEVDSNLRVLESQRDELQHRFERSHTRKQRLEDLLAEARLMREQLARGGDASAPTSGLALLALKTRVFAPEDIEPPGEPEAPPSDEASVEAGVETSVEVSVNVPPSDTPDMPLPFHGLELQLPSVDSLSSATSAAEQIADLDSLIGAMEQEIVILEASIQEQTQSLAQGQSYQFLKSLSPDYLDIAGSQAAQALLRMKEWDGLLSYSAVLDEALSQEVDLLEEHVRALRAEISRLSGLKGNLTQDRDLARQAYNSLLSKEQELEIATASEGTEVRFASQALPPRDPVSPKKLMNTAVGLALGLMLGVFGAFLFDYIGIESDPRSWRRGTIGKDD